MNTIKLDIQQNTKDNKYYVRLKIDGNEFLEPIDKELDVIFFQALRDSICKSDKYLIFTCWCGVADCGGWDYVNITHQLKNIVWDFIYNEKPFHFEFSLEQYKKEIQKIESQMVNETLVLEPKFIIEPE